MKNAKALANEIEGIWDAAERAGRSLTGSEREYMAGLVEELKSQHELEQQIKSMDPGGPLLGRMNGAGGAATVYSATTPGDRFVQSGLEDLDGLVADSCAAGVDRDATRGSCSAPGRSTPKAAAKCSSGASTPRPSGSRTPAGSNAATSTPPATGAGSGPERPRRHWTSTRSRRASKGGTTDEPDPPMHRTPMPQLCEARREQVRQARAPVRARTLTPPPRRTEATPLQHRAPRRPPASSMSCSKSRRLDEVRGALRVRL